MTIAPRHVAIIMDGNGRWAKARGAPRALGHRAGKDAVDRVVSHCARQGVAHLTLFAFSTENWKRPSAEVALLMRLMRSALSENAEKLSQNNIRLRVLGDRQALSPALIEAIARAENQTAHNSGMELVLALNYSGRWALRTAAANAAKAGVIPQTEAEFRAFFPQPHLPDVDLLIRSSGEMRLSNFLLWEMAYAELYFTEVLWPDIDEALIDKAFAAYQSRERRFGALPSARACQPIPQNSPQNEELSDA